MSEEGNNLVIEYCYDLDNRTKHENLTKDQFFNRIH